MNPQEVVAALKSLGIPALACNITRQLSQAWTTIQVDCDHVYDQNSRVTLTYQLDDFSMMGGSALPAAVEQLARAYERETGMALTNAFTNQWNTWNTTWNNSGNILYNGDPRDLEIQRLRAELEAIKGQKVKAEEEEAVASILDVLAKRTRESM